jgi:SOS-response transcriptional repressor LexA
MGWATGHIAALQKGESVTFRPNGTSMEPIVMDGQEVTVDPVFSGNGVEIGDVVLCRIRGGEYFHKVLARDRRKFAFQIGNNKGHVNGWANPNQVYGKMRRSPVGV